MDCNAHLVDSHVSSLVAGSNVERIDAVVEGFDCHSWDRSELVESLETSDSIRSG